MRRGTRRVISIMVMLLMVLALLPTSAMAATNDSAVSLEKAIQKVKQNFLIPPEYTEFTSSFRSSDNQQMWSLSWTDKEGKEGSFTAELDAATGVITSMHIYKQDRQSTEIPKISIEQAQNLGLDLIKRLIPDRMEDLQFIPYQQIVPLSDGGQYVLRWQRVVNKIPVGDEGVTIQIDNRDGSINSYDLNWSNKAIPVTKEYIPQQDAAKVVTSKEMLELQYLIPVNRVLVQAGTKSQPQLVYRLNHPSHGLIDAVTGEPIENQSPIIMKDKAGMGSSENIIASQDAVLSPQEQAEIERTLSLISQEKAVSIVRQWITIPSTVKLDEANLSQDYQIPDNRVWNLSWSAGASSKATYSYFNARVNAGTGELQSFYAEPENTGDLKPVLDKAGAEKIAKDFLHKIQPNKENTVRLEADTEQNIYPQENTLPSQWTFPFTRLVNGIPCPSQGIRIVVDSATKQIRSYNLDWAEMDFPSADKVFGMEKAYEKYLQSQPLTLHYQIIYPEAATSTASGEYKLVYSPQAEISGQQSDMIDATTGEALAWDGSPVAQSLQPYAFTDIAGYFAEKEISMLGQAGIMTEYGTAFHPQEKISLVTVLRAMLIAQNSYYNVNNKSDEEIIQEAIQNKWLKEEMKPDTLVTTELLSKLMIRMLDIDYIAQMSAGALQAPYQDFAGLNAELKGYAALTWGLGIIKGNGVIFDAAHQTTRGEAAAVLVRTLKVAGQRNN